jgi:hypothetical protein
MAVEDGAERTFQSFGVHAAIELHNVRDVVSGRAGIELVQKPHLLLPEG